MYNISANIICKNEKYWIRESIESIVELVDDIIYVDDQSTDGSLDIVKELCLKYKNIKIFEYQSHNLTELGDLKNFAISKSKNEFVLRWDADFIAYDDISNLFEYCIKNEEKFDGYILNGPNLSGDIYHQPINKDFFGPECYLFKKNKGKFIKNEKYSDYPHFEPSTNFCYPQNTELKKSFYFIHLNTLKSVERITFRKRMSEYQISGDSIGYWNWLSKITNNKNIKEEEINKTLKSELYIKEFDFEKWGEHPKILLESKSKNLFLIKNEECKYFINQYPIY